MNEIIQLIFEPNNSLHDDLVLKFPGGEHRCDSYYIALGACNDLDNMSVEALRGAIRTLLSQWLEVVEEAQVVDTLYLPFGFSDQCTAWVRCKFENVNVTLDIGGSLIEGWSFSPNYIRDIVRKVSDFQAIESASSIAMNRSALANAIKANVAELE